MLLPHDAGVCVAPVPTTARKLTFDATVTTLTTTVVSDVAYADPKTVLRQTTKKNDGTFVEAVINRPAPGSGLTMDTPDSMSPLGISPIKSKAQGTFFYSGGFAASSGFDAAAKRIGFVRLGIPERINNPRDYDDDDDGHHTSDPSWRVGSAGDADGDGVPDAEDTSTSRENMTGFDPSALPGMTSIDYPVTASAGTLALIAAVEADPLAQVAVDIYNGLGVLAATSGPLVGAGLVTVPMPGAGNYTVKVRNLSTGAITQTPTVFLRDSAVPQP
jgi:hypothetical protein